MQTSTLVVQAREGDRATFGALSRFNHWVVALAMLFALGAGLALEYVPLADGAKSALVGWHKSVGVLVLVFGLWRVGWRLLQGFPTSAASMSRPQEVVARVLHWTLLAAVLAMPLSGVLMTIYSGRPVDVFGAFSIPAAGQIEWAAQAARAAHGLMGKLLVALVALHVGAALKHHFIDRDATLVRMTSGRVTR